MKKILVILMILAMVSAGCCSLTAPDGTVTKSAANCFKTAQDKVCNAPANVLAMIDGVISIASIGVSAFVPGSAAYIAALGAFGTATTIKDGLCVSLAQLNNLIAFIQSPEAQALQTKMMAKKGVAKMAVVNIDPLINWRDKAK